MEKIIKINGYEFAAKSTAASLLSYKANFGRDGIKDLLSLAKSMPDTSGGVENINIEQFDIDVFFRFLWVFAKAAKPDIFPLEQWLESFDVPPFDFAAAVLPQISDLLGSTIKSTVASKN